MVNIRLKLGYKNYFRNYISKHCYLLNYFAEYGERYPRNTRMFALLLWACLHDKHYHPNLSLIFYLFTNCELQLFPSSSLAFSLISFTSRMNDFFQTSNYLLL